MKAQYVFENIQFHRGRDPKSVMKVGKVSEFKELEEYLKTELDRCIPRGVSQHQIEAFGHYVSSDPTLNSYIMEINDLADESLDWVYHLKGSIEEELFKYREERIREHLWNVYGANLQDIKVISPVKSFNLPGGRKVVRRNKKANPNKIIIQIRYSTTYEYPNE